MYPFNATLDKKLDIPFPKKLPWSRCENVTRDFEVRQRWGEDEWLEVAKSHQVAPSSQLLPTCIKLPVAALDKVTGPRV